LAAVILQFTRRYRVCRYASAAVAIDRRVEFRYRRGQNIPSHVFGSAAIDRRRALIIAERMYV
jgi:hypothetical protein